MGISSDTTTIAVTAGLADRLAQLIRVPTVSLRTGRDEAAFARFRTLLSQMYPLTHQRLDHELVAGGSLLFHWPGAGGPSTLLMAHYDVVPATAPDWARAPFSGEVDEGKIHGRGCLDDKGPLFVILEAVESLLAQGITPDGDVYLSFGDDEEIGGPHATVVAGLLESRGVRPDLVVDEGGAIVSGIFPVVAGDLAMIGVTEKGIANLRLTARGRAGHASAPEKNGPAVRLARAIVAIERNPFRFRSNPVISEMVRTLAARMPKWLAPVVSARITGPLIPRLLARLRGPAGALARTTVGVTTLSGSPAANVLADEATATLNVRIALGESLAATRDHLTKVVRGTGVTVDIEYGNDPIPTSPTSGAAYERVKAALARSHPDALPVPYVMVQASDSRHFVKISRNIYRFMPFAISASQLQSIHGADENLDISALASGIEFYRHLIAAGSIAGQAG
jgi:carboxypeptidase PM20D1